MKKFCQKKKGRGGLPGLYTLILAAVLLIVCTGSLIERRGLSGLVEAYGAQEPAERAGEAVTGPAPAEEQYKAGDSGQADLSSQPETGQETGQEENGKAETGGDGGDDPSASDEKDPAAGTGGTQAAETDGQKADPADKDGGQPGTGPDAAEGGEGAGKEGAGKEGTGGEGAAGETTAAEAAKEEPDSGDPGAGQDTEDSGRTADGEKKAENDENASEPAGDGSGREDSPREAGGGEQDTEKNTPKDLDSQAGHSTAEALPSSQTGDTAAAEEEAGAAGLSEAAPLPAEGTEEDLTEGENRRAYLSATSGALRAAASTLSAATVISKGDEIDYEELGFSTGVSGHIDHTTPIRIRDENNDTYTGICVVPDDRGWLKGDVLPDVRRVTDADLIKLYYYTMLDDYGLKLAQSRGFGDIAEEASVAACHEAMARRYAELAGIEYDRPNVNSTLKSLVKAYESGVASLPVPDSDKVFVYVNGRKRVDGHWRQAYVFGRSEEEEPSNVTLVKACSDSNMRAGFGAYSLHQTESGDAVTFRLYTDEACTQKAEVYADEERTQLLDPIPVGKTSLSGLTNRTVFYCDPGTYYMKELTTPKGYQTAEKPFGPYTLEEGKGRTIKIQNTPRYAKAGICKLDAETKDPVAGARFGFYADKEDAQNEEKPDAVLTTGSDGRTGTVDVLLGRTYYVREISAPSEYKTDTAIRKMTPADSFSQTTWTQILNEPKKGKAQVKKTSADPGADHSPYSLAGAVYTLCDSSGKTAATLKTGADGTSEAVEVRCGTYTLKETAPSPGFKLDPKTYTVVIRENELTAVSSVEEPRKGKISVRKYSSEEKEKKEPDTMPIAGAVYSLYLTEEDAKEGRGAAGTFVIKEDGTSNLVEMLVGRTYYVKETKTPEGYLPDEEVHPVSLKEFEKTVQVDSEDRLIFGGVRAAKLDEETGTGAALGGATLKGAVFRIYNDGARSVYAGGKKILPGAEALTLETDAEGIAETAERALSYGDYRIEEVSPPEGYTIRGARPVKFRIREDGVIVDLAEKAETSIQNQVMRGDFSLRKLNAYSQRRMSGVTFEISGYDREGNVIETHRFTTDVNGNYDSAAGTGTDRLWFGKGTSEAHFSSGDETETAGALPYGDYRIQEIEGDNNRGMKMFSESFSVYADRQMIELGNIENTLKPSLATELVDEDSDHYADGSGRVTLTDTVEYSGMEDQIGTDVTFRGIIYVKETEKPLLIDGRTVESVLVKKIMAPSGTVRLRFTFDASKAEGKTLVCYEYAYEGDLRELISGSSGQEPEGGEGTAPDPGDQDGGSGEDPGQEPGKDEREEKLREEEIASHTDPEDEAQTVRLVRIETQAEDSLTGTRIGYAGEGAVTVDHVTCEGLVPGREYRVRGFLVDKSTGRPLKDKAGDEVRAEAAFKAKEETETVDLTFRYDASLLEGTTAVAFERLYLEGEPGQGTPEDETPIASHEDPDDEDQTIHYPRVRTVAAGKEDEKVITVGDRSGVVDHVFWYNLIPGRPYRLRGVLVCRDSGKPVISGEEEVTAQTTFVPETADGDLEMTFSVDSSVFSAGETAGTESGQAAEGFRAVVFEDLYLLPAGGESSAGEEGEKDPVIPPEGVLVASHSDLKDEEQTVCLKPAEPDKPSEPGKPETPEKPSEPDTPEKPSEPDRPEAGPGDKETKETAEKTSTKRSIRPASPNTVPMSSSSTSSSPRTGDETRIASFLIPGILAAACAAGILFGKKKKKK